MIVDYHIFYSKEDGGYIAQHNQLPGISAFGKTLQDLVAEIEVLSGVDKGGCGIDSKATHDKVRGKYGGIPAFCRAHSFSARTYYNAVIGARGQANRKSDAKRILECLKEEDLLVLVPSSPTRKS